MPHPLRSPRRRSWGGALTASDISAVGARKVRAILTFRFARRTGERPQASRSNVTRPDAQDRSRRRAKSLPMQCALGDRRRGRSADGSRRRDRSPARARGTSSPRAGYSTALVYWSWTRATYLFTPSIRRQEEPREATALAPRAIRIGLDVRPNLRSGLTL